MNHLSIPMLGLSTLGAHKHYDVGVGINAGNAVPAVPAAVGFTVVEDPNLLSGLQVSVLHLLQNV